MIKGLAADIIISIYLILTLFLRFIAEDGMRDKPILSIAVGLVLISVLWALIKADILAPNYFGLLDKKSKEKDG